MAGFGTFHNTYCIKKGPHLISDSDSIDTAVDEYDEIMDIRNMYNAWYPKDILKKTRLAKASRARNGWFVYSTEGWFFESTMDLNLIAVTDANFKDEVVKSEIPVFVVFYEYWNVDAKRLCTELRDRALIYEGMIKFVFADVREVPDMINQYESIKLRLFLSFGTVKWFPEVWAICPLSS